MAKTKGNRGRRETGTRRGSGSRKHGLERWATHWMNDNFDYYDDYMEIDEIEGGSTAEDIEDAIDECYEYIEKWEDIASMMCGTVFLDACSRLCWDLLAKAYNKVARLQGSLEDLEEEE